MQSIRKPTRRVIALSSLLFLSQCCCCILPVRWGIERLPANRAIQMFSPDVRGSLVPVESMIRFAR